MSDLEKPRDKNIHVAVGGPVEGLRFAYSGKGDVIGHGEGFYVKGDPRIDGLIEWNWKQQEE